MQNCHLPTGPHVRPPVTTSQNMHGHSYLPVGPPSCLHSNGPLVDRLTTASPLIRGHSQLYVSDQRKVLLDYSRVSKRQLRRTCSLQCFLVCRRRFTRGSPNSKFTTSTWQLCLAHWNAKFSWAEGSTLGSVSNNFTNRCMAIHTCPFNRTVSLC